MHKCFIESLNRESSIFFFGTGTSSMGEAAEAVGNDAVEAEAAKAEAKFDNKFH